MGKRLSQSVSAGDPGGHRHNIEIEYRAGLNNVDKSRSCYNVPLVDESLHAVYAELFGKAIEEYNERQSRADRRIGDYLQKIEASKQEKASYEMVVQVGNMQTNSAELPSNRDLSEKVYREFLSKLQRAMPQLRIYQAVIHNDEATPHLHIAYVPFSTGNQRGLETKNSLSGAYRQMGFEDIRDANRAMREMLREAAAEHGIERLDMACSRKRLDVRDYKAQLEILEQEGIYPHTTDPDVLITIQAMTEACRDYEAVLDERAELMKKFCAMPISFGKLSQIRDMQQTMSEALEEGERRLEEPRNLCQTAIRFVRELVPDWINDNIINPIGEALKRAREKTAKIVTSRSGKPRTDTGGVASISVTSKVVAKGGAKRSPGQAEKEARNQAAVTPWREARKGRSR